MPKHWRLGSAHLTLDRQLGLDVYSPYPTANHAEYRSRDGKYGRHDDDTNELGRAIEEDVHQGMYEDYERAVDYVPND